jgi:hypothetical protein
MAIAQTLSVASAAGDCAVRLRRFDVKKSSASKDFGQQWEDPGWTQSRKPSETSVDRSSHSGTDGVEPLWSGPPLRGPFVAQLLGQLLASGRVDPRAVARAYGNRLNGRALFLNDLA